MIESNSKKKWWCIILMLLATPLCSSQNSFPDINPLVAAARAQVGVTVSYDPSYVSLEYPGGDLPMATGVCTDVVIRALRRAYGIDLQKVVHEDMKRNFSHYPKNWGLKTTDRNIDHRRVPNLETYFKRAGYRLPTPQNANDYQPGDLVTCIVPPNLPHIMIVSNRKNTSGTPLIIHNIGRGAQEEDRLFEFELDGHYRIPIPTNDGGNRDERPDNTRN